MYKVLLENDFVKVIDIRIGRGEITPMHAHTTPYLTYALGPCTVRFTAPDGHTEEAEMQLGDVQWHKAEMHQSANIGDTEARVLFVGVKEQSAMMTAGRVPAPPPTTAVPDYRVIFENDAVRVADVRMPRGAVEPMHSHRAGYLSYPLSPCRVRFTSFDGKTEEVTIDAGAAEWHDPETHQVENRGAGDCDVLVIEMKR